MTDRIRLRKIDAAGLAGEFGARLDDSWNPWWNPEFVGGCPWGEAGGYRKWGDSTLKIGATFLEGRPSEILEFIDYAETIFWNNSGEGDEDEYSTNFGWDEVPPHLLPHVFESAKRAEAKRAWDAKDELKVRLDEIVARALPGFKNYAELEREVKAGFTPTLRDDLDPEVGALRDALDYAVNGDRCAGDERWRLAVDGSGVDTDWRPRHPEAVG